MVLSVSKISLVGVEKIFCNPSWQLWHHQYLKNSTKIYLFKGCKKLPNISSMPVPCGTLLPYRFHQAKIGRVQGLCWIVSVLFSSCQRGGVGGGGGSKICSPNHILSFGNLKNLTNLTGSTMSEGHMQKQIRFLKSAGKL